MTAAQAPEVGDKTFYIAADLPDRLPPFVYIATREWAEENPETVAAFKTSLDKALVFEEADMKGALEVFSHFVNMPEEFCPSSPSANSTQMLGQTRSNFGWI